MLADYFTKPLNGSLFKYFRDIIMGYTPVQDIIDRVRRETKKRVENTQKNEISSSFSQDSRDVTNNSQVEDEK